MFNVHRESCSYWISCTDLMIQGHIDRDWKILIENILHVSVKLQIALWVKKMCGICIWIFVLQFIESNLNFEAKNGMLFYDSKLFHFHPLCNIANPTHEKELWIYSFVKQPILGYRTKSPAPYSFKIMDIISMELASSHWLMSHFLPSSHQSTKHLCIGNRVLKRAPCSSSCYHILFKGKL